ncbi:MAG: alpha-L-fucosidase [Clostridia bacterium]|nr:alpha-L-fucosidase [Clostridia bacterium]
MTGTKQQLDFLDWEFGVFFHFGIRSFFPGRRDWDGIEMPASGFDPKELDCAQWIKAAKQAGAKYAILTCKHHDGFALWPSTYSRYGVAQSPWKGGKGDVVKEFTDACRAHGLKVGLYYSPAQWGSFAIPFSNAKEYDDYFIGQLGELLSNYGKIDYLWFDGCGSEGHEFDKKRIVAEIYRMQPEILCFCDPEWAPGVRWVGNEDGYASLNNPLVVSSTDFSELATEEQRLAEACFLPAECDCKIRNTWFYDNNEETLKSVDELFGMYEMSVGHGSNFLLNIGPDDRGLLPEADRARLLELGERIKNAFGTPLDYSDPVCDGNVYTLTHNALRDPVWKLPLHSHLCNCLVLKEDLTKGQSIKSFRIYAYMPNYKKKKILLFEGRTVGHKAICRFGAIRASRFEIEITDHQGEFALNEIKGYFVK